MLNLQRYLQDQVKKAYRQFNLEMIEKFHQLEKKQKLEIIQATFLEQQQIQYNWYQRCTISEKQEIKKLMQLCRMRGAFLKRLPKIVEFLFYNYDKGKLHSHTVTLSTTVMSGWQAFNQRKKIQPKLSEPSIQISLNSQDQGQIPEIQSEQQLISPNNQSFSSRDSSILKSSGRGVKVNQKPQLETLPTNIRGEKLNFMQKKQKMISQLMSFRNQQSQVFNRRNFQSRRYEGKSNTIDIYKNSYISGKAGQKLVNLPQILPKIDNIKKEKRRHNQSSDIPLELMGPIINQVRVSPFNVINLPLKNKNKKSARISKQRISSQQKQKQKSSKGSKQEQQW